MLRILKGSREEMIGKLPKRFKGERKRNEENNRGKPSMRQEGDGK